MNTVQIRGNQDKIERSSPNARRRSREEAFPAAGTIRPMMAKASELPLNSDSYGIEIKWDGVRVLMHSNSGHTSLVSRNLLSITHRYPELQQLSEILAEHQVVLDGEIIALGDDGRPDFNRLQERIAVNSAIEVQRRVRDIPVLYMIFDILHLDGKSLLSLPYHERRRILEQMELVGPSWQTPPYFTGEGSAILDVCRQQRLEGLIAKKLISIYEPGRQSNDWLKVKVRPRQEFVIGGWLPGEGAREGSIGSLLVGYYDQGSSDKLRYAGRVGTGFSDTSLKQLENTLRYLVCESSPFTETETSLRGAVYVKPLLVSDVEFADWTNRHTLRQPSFKGLKSDKDPHDVKRTKN